MRMRGESFLEADMKTRKKEKLISVFALSEEELQKLRKAGGAKRLNSATNQGRYGPKNGA